MAADGLRSTSREAENRKPKYINQQTNTDGSSPNYVVWASGKMGVEVKVVSKVMQMGWGQERAG